MLRNWTQNHTLLLCWAIPFIPLFISVGLILLDAFFIRIERVTDISMVIFFAGMVLFPISFTWIMPLLSCGNRKWVTQSIDSIPPKDHISSFRILTLIIPGISTGLFIIVLIVETVSYYKYQHLEFNLPWVVYTGWFSEIVITTFFSLLIYKMIARQFRYTIDKLPACFACGYNLTGAVSPTCPECGHPIPGRDIGPAAQDTE